MIARHLEARSISFYASLSVGAACGLVLITTENVHVETVSLSGEANMRVPTRKINYERPQIEYIERGIERGMQ